MQVIELNTEAIYELKTQSIIRGQVLSYRSLSMAVSVRDDRSVKPMRIIMGDCPWYWVVSPADAERLIRAGYEMI